VERTATWPFVRLEATNSGTDCRRRLVTYSDMNDPQSAIGAQGVLGLTRVLRKIPAW